MDHNARIEAAIADLRSQKHTNFAATAKKWNLERTTLAKRFRGETGTIQEAVSYVRKQLTDTQEEALITYVNKLNDRGFPPTPQILKNIAESIGQTHLGRNWAARFCKRHHTRLASIYLRTIDHKRKIADNSHYFQHFFNLVCTQNRIIHIHTKFNTSFLKKLSSTILKQRISTTLIKKAS
jgi:Tc5 transposase DNA-binding domain